MLLAAVGLLRLPDLFMRMQAATKSSTLGIACMLLAVAVHFSQLGITTLALLIIAFFFLTAPVATHMVARAAYLVGVPLWQGTVMDDLRGCYDVETHALASRPFESTQHPEAAASDEPGASCCPPGV
jgi:multicomponent Na+:H+ antiporter subunit G